MMTVQVFLSVPHALNPCVWGAMALQSKALPEVCLHQPTLFKANLLPGFMANQEEAALGVLPHLAPLCI